MVWLIMFLVLPSLARGAEAVENSALQNQLVQAQEALWACHILRQKDAEKKITDLAFKADKIPVFLMPTGGSVRPLVKLQIHYARPGWKLFVGDKIPAKPGTEAGTYLIYAYLNARISEVTLLARNAEGDVEREKVYLFAPEAREYGLVSTYDAFSVSLGAGNLTYEQTSFGVFNGYPLLLGLHYVTPEQGKPWGVVGDLRFTLTTLQSTPDEYNPQYYEGFVAGSYALTLGDDPRWRFRGLGGVSAAGVLAYGSPFGFSNLFGVDLGLRGEYFVDGQESYAFHVVYGNYDFGSLGADYALKVQLSYTHGTFNLRRLRYEFLYSHHAFGLENEDIAVDFLGLGLALSL